MRRLYLILGFLCAAGCMADDAAKSQLDAAMRDARGENMRMHGDMTRLDEGGSLPSLRPRE